MAGGDEPGDMLGSGAASERSGWSQSSAGSTRSDWTGRTGRSGRNDRASSQSAGSSISSLLKKGLIRPRGGAGADAQHVTQHPGVGDGVGRIERGRELQSSSLASVREVSSGGEDGSGRETSSRTFGSMSSALWLGGGRALPYHDRSGGAAAGGVNVDGIEVDVGYATPLPAVGVGRAIPVGDSRRVDRERHGARARDGGQRDEVGVEGAMYTVEGSGTGLVHQSGGGSAGDSEQDSPESSPSRVRSLREVEKAEHRQDYEVGSEGASEEGASEEENPESPTRWRSLHEVEESDVERDYDEEGRKQERSRGGGGGGGGDMSETAKERSRAAMLKSESESRLEHELLEMFGMRGDETGIRFTTPQERAEEYGVARARRSLEEIPENDDEEAGQQLALVEREGSHAGEAWLKLEKKVEEYNPVIVELCMRSIGVEGLTKNELLAKWGAIAYHERLRMLQHQEAIELDTKLSELQQMQKGEYGGKLGGTCLCVCVPLSRALSLVR